MDVQLIIKAPNQNFDDQVILCNLDWTIKRLKTHLSEVYPNKPVVQEQKLIYSGRLLHDHLHLKDILRHEDSQSHAHILHLVCNGKNNLQSQTQTSTSSQNLLNQPTQQVSEDLNTNSPHSNSSPVEENVLRHRNISPLSQSNSNFSPVFQPNTMQATAYPPLPNDPQYLAQMAAMQQMYAYYMTQYMQSANPAFFGNNSTFPNVSNFQPQPVNTSYVPNEAVQRPVNQRMNVQGGQIPEENEEMGNRDWLDHLSFCCRFLMLFSFMYFYSTPERLMIVVVCAIVVFLYHEGWFVRRPAVVQQPDVQNGQMNRLERDDTNDNPENANASPPNQNQSANGELQDGHELEAAMDGDEPPHVQNPDVANNNQIFSPLNFLAAFFSSLIPEPPPPVNIN